MELYPLFVYYVYVGTNMDAMRPHIQGSRVQQQLFHVRQRLRRGVSVPATGGVQNE